MKKTEGCTVPLHPEARATLSVWLEVLQKLLKGALDPQTPVCCSRVRETATGLRGAISREQAWRILKAAFEQRAHREAGHACHAQDSRQSHVQ